MLKLIITGVECVKCVKFKSTRYIMFFPFACHSVCKLERMLFSCSDWRGCKKEWKWKWMNPESEREWEIWARKWENGKTKLKKIRFILLCMYMYVLTQVATKVESSEKINRRVGWRKKEKKKGKKLIRHKQRKRRQEEKTGKNEWLAGCESYFHVGLCCWCKFFALLMMVKPLLTSHYWLQMFALIQG